MRKGAGVVAELDALDLALVTALRENPRAGALELSRVTKVARATVESRLRRMEQAGAITGSADVVCKVAATSHADLQQVLLRIDSSPSVARSTSAIVLSTVIVPR